MRPEEELAALRAENLALRVVLAAGEERLLMTQALVEEVETYVTTLKEQVALENHTNDKPVADDGIVRKKDTSRKKRGKKAGG